MSKRRAKRKPSVAVKAMSRKKIGKILQKQKEQRAAARTKLRAEKAARSFRPRKTEKGKIVFISTKGKRGAENKGRKGYAIFVSKSGKKHLLKDRMAGFKPAKIGELNIPIQKKLHKAATEFFQSHRKISATGKGNILKGSGSIKPRGPYDFSDKTVKKIANSLKKTFDSQLSQRRYLISANVLITLPDGSTRVHRVTVPIVKADHISIEAGGMENFIKKKFYAHLAQSLAFDGFVTTGSANHVRRLKENEGKEREEWTKGGIAWHGREDTETVHISAIEWKIEQMI